jgi:beta-N-acetylhexosaminidase
MRAARIIAWIAAKGLVWLLCLSPVQAQDAPPLAQMIGQMLIVGFTGTQAGDPGVEAVRGQLASGTIGGVLLLDRNITDPQQLRELIAALNRPNLSVSAWIAVDQEGGRVQRLPADKGFEIWVSAQSMGRRAERHSDVALQYYSARAHSLHALGINLNLAPVLDLDLNPSNPIIGKLGRSFSADATRVAALAADFIQGHHANGVLTVAKHFPGHGSSAGDSHRTLPSIATSWRHDELLPYQILAGQGLLDLVMMGHLYHPQFSDAPNRPSSISATGVTALRALVGNDVVIMTDDLQMQAVRDLYSDPDAAIEAVIAGNDVLLFNTFKVPDARIGTKINDAIVAAVKEGRISQARIAASYRRILRLKQRM